MHTDPHEVLQNLRDSDDTECLYFRDDPAYLWAGEDETYVLLEQSSSGSWYPRGRPIPAETAAQLVADETYDIRQQVELPEGRHRISRRD